MLDLQRLIDGKIAKIGLTSCPPFHNIQGSFPLLIGVEQVREGLKVQLESRHVTAMSELFRFLHLGHLLRHFVPIRAQRVSLVAPDHIDPATQSAFLLEDTVG